MMRQIIPYRIFRLAMMAGTDMKTPAGSENKVAGGPQAKAITQNIIKQLQLK